MTYIIKTFFGYVQERNEKHLIVGLRETAYQFASIRDANDYRQAHALVYDWSIVEELP